MARTRHGERVALADTRLRAPIVPKKFFDTAGDFREHEAELGGRWAGRATAPWIVFFQNVDAIVGPDEPVVYPERLTEELDYELELAVVDLEAREVVLGRSRRPTNRRVPDLDDITARDIQRREMRSGVFSFARR